jgi:hypothetical protein
MRVFLSWSGATSRQIATILRDWLPTVIQAIEPWMSSEDINKGARWSAEIAKELQTTKAGIICVTADNQGSAWLNFEAGALSRVVDKTMVCPYLFQIRPSDLKGPLVQFQATEANREDSLKLLTTLNSGLGAKALSEGNLIKAFEKWWGELEAKLEGIPKPANTIVSNRSSQDMVEEILALTREQSRATQEVRTALYQLQIRDRYDGVLGHPPAGLENLYTLRDMMSSGQGGPFSRSSTLLTQSPEESENSEEPEIDPAGEMPIR